MFTNADIAQTMAKFDQILSGRPKKQGLSDASMAYQSLSVIKKLNKARFSVYLASSKINHQYYAMKTFPYVREHPNSNFKNESRFAFLKHPNIINIVHCENERETVQKGELGKVSYLLMEYAPYGDFFNFIINNKEKLDEKLVRTYFRQLIDGIQYLHEHKIAHLDIKPENLLIGADFNLKITDFDMSYISGDPNVLSRGTKYYRAPELFRRTSHQISYPADIYSAGMVLFILKSGGIYAHAEDGEMDKGLFENLMYKNSSEFWKKHCEVEEKDASFYDSNFRKLFSGMVQSDPKDRLTIKQIKRSKWYNGPVYSAIELQDRMKRILNC